MDAKKKLMELIQGADFHPCEGIVRTIGSSFSTEFIEDVASYLIAHNVIVEAKPVRHGRWINWGKSGMPTYENYGTCSVCHEDAEIHTEHRNYCPNCGAKMDEEAE